MINNIFIDTLSRFKNNTRVQDLVIDFKDQMRPKVFQGMNLQPQNLIKRFNILQRKFEKSLIANSQLQWLEYQKKLFLWFLLAFCSLHLKRISQINCQEWQEISQCFHNKSILFMQYEARNMERHTERIQWQLTEQKMLTQFVKSQIQGNWHEISKELFFRSQGQFFKTPKQCRQHWFNHMDSTIQKGQWTIEEDLLILNFVSREGHHWSRAVTLLNHKRTEHMTKNRFSSLIVCARKLSPLENQENILIKILIKELQSNKKELKIITPSLSQVNLQQQEVGQSLLSHQPHQINYIDQNNQVEHNYTKNWEAEKIDFQNSRKRAFECSFQPFTKKQSQLDEVSEEKHIERSIFPFLKNRTENFPTGQLLLGADLHIQNDVFCVLDMQRMAIETRDMSSAFYQMESLPLEGMLYVIRSDSTNIHF